MRLYLGNITYGSGPSELRAWLAEKGVTVIDMTRPRDNNGLRPFCFIDVPDGEEESIISTLHNQEFNGRAITVNLARPRSVR